MRYLLFILLISPVRAEQITLQTRSGCNHVAILGEKGNELAIYMRDEIMAPITERDDRLLLQLKTHIAESRSATFEDAKILIETKEVTTDEEISTRATAPR